MPTIQAMTDWIRNKYVLLRRTNAGEEVVVRYCNVEHPRNPRLLCNRKTGHPFHHRNGKKEW